MKHVERIRRTPDQRGLLKKIMLRWISLLLLPMLVLAGCSHAEEQEMPADLLFFTEDLEGKDRDEVREAFREIVRTTYEKLAKQDEPYLISRLTRITAREPVTTEKGALTGFRAVPINEGGFRVVYPGLAQMRSLDWTVSNFRNVSITAWSATASEAQKAVWEENDPGSYVRDYTAEQFDVKNLAGKLQRQWIAEMFTTGFYQTARHGRPLEYDENPTIFPANPKYFQFAVLSAEDYYGNEERESEEEADSGSNEADAKDETEGAQDQNSLASDGYVLKISTREPQNYAQNLKSAGLGYLESAGEIYSGHPLIFKDYTFSEYEVTAFLSETGVLKRVVVRINPRFVATKNGEDLSAREELMSVWTIDPYPQAVSLGYPADIDAMLSGQTPPDAEELLSY